MRTSDIKMRINRLEIVLYTLCRLDESGKMRFSCRNRLCLVTILKKKLVLFFKVVITNLEYQSITVVVFSVQELTITLDTRSGFNVCLYTYICYIIRTIIHKDEDFILFNLMRIFLNYILSASKELHPLHFNFISIDL